MQKYLELFKIPIDTKFHQNPTNGTKVKPIESDSSNLSKNLQYCAKIKNILQKYLKLGQMPIETKLHQNPINESKVIAV